MTLWPSFRLRFIQQLDDFVPLLAFCSDSGLNVPTQAGKVLRRTSLRSATRDSTACHHNIHRYGCPIILRTLSICPSGAFEQRLDLFLCLPSFDAD